MMTTTAAEREAATAGLWCSVCSKKVEHVYGAYTGGGPPVLFCVACCHGSVTELRCSIRMQFMAEGADWDPFPRSSVYVIPELSEPSKP